LELPLEWDDDKPAPPPQWLVKLMILKQGIGLLSGKWGTHKTFAHVDLSLSLTTGTDFAGHKVEKCGVLNLAYESAHAIKARFKHAKNKRHPSLLKPLPFAVVKYPPLLTARSTLDVMIETALAANEKMQKRWQVRLGLITIDTLVIATGGASDRDNAEAQQVMAILRELSNETETFVLAVDHWGHGTGRTRGPSDKEATPDLVLSMTDSYMELTKCRDGPQGEKYPYKAVLDELGFDSDGYKITQKRIEWTDAVKPIDRTLLKALQRLEPHKIAVNGENRLVLTKDDVRTAFYKSQSGKSADAKRKAFNRALETIKQSSHEGTEFVWIT
jgi:hypothetical protein